MTDRHIVEFSDLCYILSRDDGEIMKHMKKMIAPIIITILIIIYFIGMGLSMTAISGLPFLYKVLYIGGPLILAIVMIAVLIGRIKEIRSGEEDDLGKY